MARTFERVHTPEPHAERRRALLAKYPAIRALYGCDRRTAYVTIAVVIAQLALASFASSLPWWALVIGGYTIGAPLTHWLSMAIHETSHGLGAKTVRGNDAIALLANVPMLLPVAMTFHRYHGAHHTYLDVEGKDTDLPLAWEVQHIGDSTWRKLAWLLVHPIAYIARGFTFAKKPTKKEISNIATIVLVDLALYRWLGTSAIVYLAISFYFAHGLHPVAGHFVHEHYTFAKGQETYSYYGPLNHITFNVGYHVEHHDFTRIAGWRLPELTRMVPEYRALVSHTSWTRILWRFVTDRSMGYASRYVRSIEAFRRHVRNERTASWKVTNARCASRPRSTRVGRTKAASR